MQNETSYDMGMKPFIHDKTRGKWASSKDFVFACAAHAFKADAVMVMPVLIFHSIGIYALIPYVIVLLISVIPIIFMQSFLGQFSSTGFISVFRIAPLFKGIGYVSLVFNLLTLTYYSVFSAIPLFYFFHSLRPTIPWSCQGSADWMKISDGTISFCNLEHVMLREHGKVAIPSVEFFRNHLNISNREIWEFSVSGQLIACTCIVWSVATFVLLKPTQVIGRFMRYSFLTVIAIMCVCLIRFVFLRGAIDGLWDLIYPLKIHGFKNVWILVPGLALSTLGPGWGSILTMASFNKFKANIFKYSWFVCLAHIGIILGMAFLSIFIHSFMKNINFVINKSYDRWQFNYSQWMEFLKIPTALTFMDWPHFWSWLFFSMWMIGCFNLLVIQLFSLMTSLFDEFEELRSVKRKSIFITVGILAMISMLFCSNDGVFFFEVLVKYSLNTQMILNLLLLLVVLWVYGRERFQRDLNFMTSRNYPTWMIYIVRFIAPIFLLIGLLVGLMFLLLSVIFDHGISSNSGFVCIAIGTLIFLLSWCLIPGYCIFKIKRTTGFIGSRFKKCVKPTDWYPADPTDKQKYEENLNSGDVSHQLIMTDFE